MDIALAEEKDKFVVVYMDHISFFSKYDRDYIKNLERVFLKCRKFGISLNPRKSNFSMQEENILGHIISKDGIRIARDRVKEIMKVELPRSKNQVHPFISQVNFLRRFILSFVEILRSVTNMLRNDSDIK